MRITIDKILSLPICEAWRDRSRLEALADGRKWIAPLTLARMEAVPLQDRRLVLLYLLQRTSHSERFLRLFACDCAERALRREREMGREPDSRAWTAVEVSRRYAQSQATEEELAAARAAAWAAARDAVRAAAGAAALDAAWAAARAAAWDAVRDAAGAAALDAAWAAARAAAWAAARDAEIGWQCEQICKYLK